MPQREILETKRQAVHFIREKNVERVGGATETTEALFRFRPKRGCKQDKKTIHILTALWEMEHHIPQREILEIDMQAVQVIREDQVEQLHQLLPHRLIAELRPVQMSAFAGY